MRSAEFENARVRAGSLSVNAMLAAAGGYLDGFTYVGHGHVFANAMTANVVLFGAIVTASWQMALDYLAPIIAFLGAVWAAQAIQFRSKIREARAPYSAVILWEVTVLPVLSLLPSHTNSMLFTSGIAFAASVQMQTSARSTGAATLQLPRRVIFAHWARRRSSGASKAAISRQLGSHP